MKLRHDPKTDSLFIEPVDRPGTETREIAPGVLVDLDARGEAVRLDIDRASETLDRTTIETVALPLARTEAA